MPTTIPQGFAKLCSNLEISDLQAQTVSTRQQNVRDVVAADFSVLTSFLTGSYKRNTMIAPLIPESAFKKAREGIEEGQKSHRVDISKTEKS